MFHLNQQRRTIMTVAAAALATTTALAQTSSQLRRPLAANVIIPQVAPRSTGSQSSVELIEVQVSASIRDQVATTTLLAVVRNHGSAVAEAELVVPVPQGAAIRGFAFDGPSLEPTAELLPKAEADATYDAIVARMRDPALLEFIDCNLVRSSVFPVPASGTQKVQLTYEHVLERHGARVDYRLPRTESLANQVPWTIEVSIASKTPIATLYSPTHVLETTRRGKNRVATRIAPQSRTAPGSFRLSYLLATKDEVTASLMTYPVGKGGGYFLLLAGLPAAAPSSTTRREITLVIDHSGSMGGGKLDQARNAALQVLWGLEDGESFNIIAYNSTVQSLYAHPRTKDASTCRAAEAFLKSLRPNGGTNIHDALQEALKAASPAETLPMVLFLTDGLPTSGNISETAIGDLVVRHNPHERRVFTFGVGSDVNAPLLQRLAEESRARPTFVLPGEDVEVAVGQVFKGLQGPILTAPRLAPTERTALVSSQVHDMLPNKLPDLFEGDQLVVLGRYSGRPPRNFQLSGSYLGTQRTFRLGFTDVKPSTRNAFVPRLWASRRIGQLSEEIRQRGANVSNPAAVARDPRFTELVESIVDLSKEFGILTEYTAFLAREGTDLSDRTEVMHAAANNYRDRAVSVRSGKGGINQSLNTIGQKVQTTLNYGNQFYDENMNRVAITTVQQVADRAFFRRNGNWVDSRLADRSATVAPDRVVAFGTPEFRSLLGRLASQNRQGIIALRGDILLDIGGETVLITGPAPTKGVAGS